MITFETVTKTYPDGTVAVDNLSMEVPTGTRAQKWFDPLVPASSSRTR